MIIEPIEESELEDVDCKFEEEDTEEDMQPLIGTIHALTDYDNLQMIKIEEFLKHQPVTILIDTGSTNNFVDSKVVAQLTLQIEDCSRFDVIIADGRILNCNGKCPQVRLVL
ncbi:hypothetical protein GW17_00019462 [Ensete ventricosum]|nr:hypothetical protein GW17_00019462 [Ensete ventricosum]